MTFRYSCLLCLFRAYVTICNSDRCKKAEDGQRRVGGAKGGEVFLLGFERLQVEELPEVKGKIQGNDTAERQNEGDFSYRHGLLSRGLAACLLVSAQDKSFRKDNPRNLS